jgi:hypothetical protein
LGFRHRRQRYGGIGEVRVLGVGDLVVYCAVGTSNGRRLACLNLSQVK